MIEIRPVGPADIERICAHRHAMFVEAGTAVEALAAMAAPFRAWLADHLDKGSYSGFFAEDAGKIIGGVGLMVIDWPPHPVHPGDGRRGYVLNVFVEPDYRGRGLARTLMEKAEADLRARGVTYAILHATDAGRALYECMGWAQTKEMAKRL